MTSGFPPHMRGLRPEVLDSAREAARRSGMSVEEWLDTVIAESARHAGIEPGVHRLSDFDDRSESPDARNWHRDEPLPRADSFADVSARLDELARQVGHLSQATASRPSAGQSMPDSDDSGTIADVLARLDSKIDRLSAMRSAALEYTPPLAPSAGGEEGSIDQALAEIEAAQRMLDGGAAAPALAPTARTELPRAPTQRLPELEQQLRQINARLDGIRPCGIDAAVETLRDDLAEIGVMLKEAMPRQAIEALEAEIRTLASRIDNERHAGADGVTMAGVERNLAEVRDALRALTPAESLVGFDHALNGLSDKIDSIASAGTDPEALKQLEGAVVALRGVVSHVASNDALAQLSDEVRMLAARVDQVAPSSDAFALMEQRIAAIADALQQSRGVPVGDAVGLETAVRGLVDKVDQLHATRSDQTAANDLEERIMRLLEKLDASDARLDNLVTIERGLSELLMQMEGQRTAPPRSGIEGAEADALKRDVERTKDSLEAVHGTLGHVVDRLATIEAGMRDTPPRTPDPTDRRGNAPTTESSEAPLSEGLQSPPGGGPQSALFRERPAADTPPALPRANPSPTMERRPIDPTLPPDHPLEPRAGRGRSPADRIAASEAALENVRPPVIPDPAGKSNFIAAARRAAQAAIVEGPPPKDKRTTAEPASGDDNDKSLTSKLSGSIRKLVVGVGVLVFVLGAVHFITTRYWSNNAIPTAEAPTTTSQATIDETASVAEPPRVSTPAPSERQSSALPPGVTFSPNALATSVPPATLAGASADGDATGSIGQPIVQTTITSPAAVMPSPAAPVRNTPADRLPPGIAGGLRAAAANDDPAAQYEVASRLADGRGVPQNLPEAAAWFERAANQGLVPAQFRLGGLYEKGMGVSKNLDTARRLYLAAAEAGHAKAMHNLAVLYAEGIEGKPNYQTAARWFRKAADHGVLDSQYNLAILYARGIGVETNLQESFKWFALASREGDRDAAKKRDEIAARLDKQSLTAATLAAQSWQPLPQPEGATQVRVPAGGWDALAAPAAAKRIVGPKAEKQSRR